MSLRQATLLIAGLTAAACMAVIVLVSGHIIMSGYEDMENELVTDSVRRAEAALNAEAQRILTLCKDWAFWDDTRDFLTDRRPDYAEANLNDETVGNLKLNVILYYDTQGRLHRAKGYDIDARADVGVPPELLQRFASETFFVRATDPEESRWGLLSVGNRVVLAAAMPVLDSYRHGPVAGTIVMGRYVDHVMVSELASLTRLELALIPVRADAMSTDDAEALTRLERGGSILVRAPDKDVINGFALLRDTDDQPVLLLRATMNRDITSKGRTSQLYNTIGLAGSLLLIGVALYLFIDRRFLARVTTLSREVEDVDGREDLSRRVTVTGDDELTRLALSINTMLASLEESDAALSQSETLLTRSQQIARVGSLMLDLASRRLTWSDEAYRLFGLDPTSCTVSYETFLERVHPDDRAIIEEAQQGSLRNGLETYAIEYRIFRADSGEMRHLSMKCVHESDRTGIPARTVGIVHDITEEKLAEEALRANERRAIAQRQAMVRLSLDKDMLDNALEQQLARMTEITAATLGVARSSVWLFSADKTALRCLALHQVGIRSHSSGDIQLSSELRHYISTLRRENRIYAADTRTDPRLGELLDSSLIPLGITSLLHAGIFIEGELVGLVCVDHIGPQRHWIADEEAFVGAMATLAAQWIVSGQRKLAEQALLLAHTNLEKQVDDRTRDLAGQAEELEQANQKLRALDDLKSNLVSTVSHELRTPLTSILGFAKLISKEFARYFRPLEQHHPTLTIKGERIEDNLQIVIQETDRLNRLVSDMLDLARIESGRQEWADRPMDFGDCVRSAINSFRGGFMERPAVTLSDRIEENLPMIEADPDRISQVVVNLLSNAVKFTKEGHVAVTVQSENNDGQRMVSLNVEDTGCGISPEDQSRIFDKFYQTGERILTDKPKGTGLGLAICRQIVEHYGGDIRVESIPDCGARFLVRLPVFTQTADSVRA